MENKNMQNRDFLEMIEAATKAPSGHNTQPWLFRLNEDSIDVIPNMEYRLPIVDRSNRELFMSIGAAIENLCIKASQKGYSASVTIDELTKISTINLIKTELQKDTLVDQIVKRQTNRKIYNSKVISSDVVNTLNNIHTNADVNRYIVPKEDPFFEIMKRYVSLGNELQLNDEKFRDELLRYIRLNKQEVKDNPTGLSYKVMGAPSLPIWISKPIIKSFLKPHKQNKSDMKKIDSSSHLVLFTTKNNTLNEWIDLGRDLQRFLLTTTSLGIANAYMNQPLEINELAAQIRRKYPEIRDEYPTLLLRIGYAKSAPFSPRKDINDVIL